MTAIDRKIHAEVKVRALVESQGIPAPDRIEYGETCIRLFWDGPKVVLVVDLEDEPAETPDRDLNVDAA
jgi:hypothetical protein